MRPVGACKCNLCIQTSIRRHSPTARNGRLTSRDVFAENQVLKKHFVRHECGRNTANGACAGDLARTSSGSRFRPVCCTLHGHDRSSLPTPGLAAARRTAREQPGESPQSRQYLPALGWLDSWSTLRGRYGCPALSSRSHSRFAGRFPSISCSLVSPESASGSDERDPAKGGRPKWTAWEVLDGRSCGTSRKNGR